MNVQEAYNQWSNQYDSNINTTRDLEALALQSTLPSIQFNSCVELGCGTGKNTQWLCTKAKQVIAVDFSSAMLQKAKEKISAKHVEFVQANLLEPWNFSTQQADLITFSLVLEHIEQLNPIFEKVAQITTSNAYLYIGELHPFKQYNGSKARFETPTGQQEVTCYNHHISDFTEAALNNGFEIVCIKEFFDEKDKTGLPRILSILFKKTSL